MPLTQIEATLRGGLFILQKGGHPTRKKYVPRRLKGAEPQEPTGRSLFLWVWEFSKRLVLICTGIYITEQIYAMVSMWHFKDFTYLGTMIEQTSDILRTCVFGYLVKAGIENVCKIWTNRSQGDEETPEE